METIKIILMIFGILFSIAGLALVTLGYRTDSKITKDIEEYINEQR